MLDILYRNVAVMLVFLLVAGGTWLYGGARPQALLAYGPWFLLLALEGFLFLPQRRPFEDGVSARRRLGHALYRDPLFHVALALVVYLAMPLLNLAPCPNCDAAALAAGAAPAAVAWLPACFRAADQIAVMTWFVPALVAMLAVRHAFVKEGKRVFMELIVWNAVALAVFGFIEQATGASFVFWERPEHPTYFFSVFGYPNQGGAFFVMAYAFSIGLWRHRAQEAGARRQADINRHAAGRAARYLLSRHYLLFAAVLLFFAVLYTRSRAAVLLATALSVLAAVYVILEALGRRVERVRRLRMITATGVGLIVLGVGVSVFAPRNLSGEMGSADLTAIADRMTGKNAWHADAAFAIFKEHPFFGAGGWGYKHLNTAYMPEEVRKATGQWYSRGGANVHNDYLQFLCEHGAVGALMMLGVVLFLVGPLALTWNRIYRATRFMRADKAPPKPRAVFVLPAPVFWILAGNVCVFIHAFGDCPLRGASVLMMVLSSLAAAEGFMPHEDEIEGDASEAEHDTHHHHAHGAHHHHAHGGHHA